MDEDSPPPLVTAPWWARGQQPPGPHRHTRTPVRRVTGRGAVLAVALAAVLSGGVGSVLTVSAASNEVDTWGNGHSVRASVDALAAGCGRQFFVTSGPKSRVVTDLSDATGRPRSLPSVTIVPVQGLMGPDPVPTGVRFWAADDPTAPRPEQVTRSLWDGRMVAYYQPWATEQVQAALRTLAQSEPDLDLIVVPWPQHREGFPSRRVIAYAAWNSVQYCNAVLPAQVRAFRATVPAAAAPGADGTAPPTL